MSLHKVKGGEIDMGKPSKGTPKDMRLKGNNPNAGKAKPKPATQTKKSGK